MKKILVVDDDVDILNVVQLVLDAKGFDVIATPNWQQINTHVDEFKPDLILLDVSLGSQDGRNICKQLKSNKNTKHISVILFSANHNIESSLSECLADNFISKPFDINELVDGINSQIMKSERA